jgi:hypothetical protein
MLILAWKPFSKLSPEDRDRVLEVIDARPVLFIHNAGPKKQPVDVTHTVVVGQHGIAGMGEAGWYRRVAGVVQAETDERARAAAGVSLDDIADDA